MSAAGSASSLLAAGFFFSFRPHSTRPLLRSSSLSTSLLAPLGPFMASRGIRHQRMGLAGFYWIFSYFLLSCGLQEAGAHLSVQLFVLRTQYFLAGERLLLAVLSATARPLQQGVRPRAGRMSREPSSACGERAVAQLCCLFSWALAASSKSPVLSRVLVSVCRPRRKKGRGCHGLIL